MKDMTTSEHMSALARRPRKKKPCLCDCGNLGTRKPGKATACERCRAIEHALAYDAQARLAHARFERPGFDVLPFPQLTKHHAHTH